MTRTHLLGSCFVAASFLSLWACGSSEESGTPPIGEMSSVDGGGEATLTPDAAEGLPAPAVIATTPANGAVGQPKDFPVVTATFSTAMDPTSIGPASFTVSAGNVSVGGAVSFDGGTATFTPTTPFTVGETFKATLTTAVKDAAGTPLRADHTWTFSTTSDFELDVPAFDVQAANETYVCYHFQTPNDRDIALESLTSSMQGAAGKELAVVLTSGNSLPPGTLSAANCQVPPYANAPGFQGAIVFSTHKATDALTFPNDDGTGKPLAMKIPANQAGFIRIRVLNPTEDVVKVSASLGVKALPTGTPYTRIAPLIASNTHVDVPANAVNDVETKSCAVPTSMKFWRVTTHTHRQAVSASVLDGANPVVVTNDWQAPAVATFAAPAFKTFSSGALTYSCTYTNAGPRRLAGPSPFVDEACMAVTYYFPATPTPSFLPALGARFCLNDGLLP